MILKSPILEMFTYPKGQTTLIYRFSAASPFHNPDGPNGHVISQIVNLRHIGRLVGTCPLERLVYKRNRRSPTKYGVYQYTLSVYLDKIG